MTYTAGGRVMAPLKQLNILNPGTLGICNVTWLKEMKLHLKVKELSILNPGIWVCHMANGSEITAQTNVANQLSLKLRSFWVFWVT